MICDKCKREGFVPDVSDPGWTCIECGHHRHFNGYPGGEGYPSDLIPDYYKGWEFKTR